MEPILSKQEIADLLTAIKDGRVAIGTEAGSSEQHASYPSLDLFRVSNQFGDQIRIPNFDIIIDAFCHNYSISLTNYLQRTFSITRTGLESMSFQEYLLTKKNPGSIGVLNLSPLKYGGLVLFDPRLSFSLIEIMLGASTDLDLLQLDRQLTKIEMTVIKSIMAKTCEDLDRAFRPLTSMKSSLLKIENNPRLVSITDPESEVIIASLDVTVGEMSGVMEMVFPLATLEPLREALKDLLNIITLRHGGWTDIIINELTEMSATIVAQSGVIDLSVGQVMGFKEGDIINLNYDLNSSLKVLVEEKLKFFAVPGVHKGKKAIRLTGINE